MNNIQSGPGWPMTCLNSGVGLRFNVFVAPLMRYLRVGMERVRLCNCPACLCQSSTATSSPNFWSVIMIRVSSSIFAVVWAALFAGSPGIQAAEIARYDDGPLAGKGSPISESARVGDLLFLAGQIGEDKDGNLVPGG